MGKVLLCALLEDNGRTMFLEHQMGETVCYSLPCVLADEKENPIELLKKLVLQKTGIDAQIGLLALTGKHNAGSRRRKLFVNALCFVAKAKSFSTKTKVKWVALKEAGKLKLCRESEWLKNAGL